MREIERNRLTDWVRVVERWSERDTEMKREQRRGGEKEFSEWGRQRESRGSGIASRMEREKEMELGPKKIWKIKVGENKGIGVI